MVSKSFMEVLEDSPPDGGGRRKRVSGIRDDGGQ